MQRFLYNPCHLSFLFQYLFPACLVRSWWWFIIIAATFYWSLTMCQVLCRVLCFHVLINLDIRWGLGTIFIFLRTLLGLEHKSKSEAGTWHCALKQELKRGAAQRSQSSTSRLRRPATQIRSVLTALLKVRGFALRAPWSPHFPPETLKGIPPYYTSDRWF